MPPAEHCSSGRPWCALLPRSALSPTVVCWMLKTSRWFVDDRFALSSGAYHPTYHCKCAPVFPPSVLFVRCYAAVDTAHGIARGPFLSLCARFAAALRLSACLTAQAYGDVATKHNALTLICECSKRIAQVLGKLAVFWEAPLADDEPSNGVAVMHYEDPAKQRGVAKVARGPQFGYALKQMNTCRRRRCDLSHNLGDHASRAALCSTEWCLVC